MLNENFYSQLKKFFKGCGITQNQMAEVLGADQSYISQLLNGKCSLGRATAQKLSDAYGLSVAWLLTGEGNMLKTPAAGGQVNNINVDASGNSINASGNASVKQTVGTADTCSQLMEQNKKLMDIVSDQQKQINQLLQLLSTKL